MADHRPTPSELRMAELCTIRRELTEEEVREALRLSRRIRENESRRNRFGHKPRPWPGDRRAYFAARYQARKQEDRA